MIVRADHPRLFLLPGILTTLKTRAVKPTSRWDTLLSLVNRSGGASWDIGIENYALSYAVTGNSQYAANAYALMSESMANGLTQITPDRGYPCRSYFPAAALCYDWLYSWMSPAQRTALQADLEANADWVWEETNPSRKGAWAIDNPGSNYYHGFMLTLMAGLALSGDSPKAQGYIDNAMHRWNTAVVPYLATQARGGYLFEGTNYGVSSLRSMLWYLMAQSTATDSPLLTPVSQGWVGDACSQIINLTTPDLARLYPGGDQPQNSGRPINDYDRGCMLIAASLNRPAAKWWLDNVFPNPDQQRNNAWEEALWYPEEMVGGDYTKTWKGYSFCRGAGLVQSRSDWGPNATQLFFQCGTTTESHQDRNQGHFMLFKSDWLAAQVKLFSKSGLAQDAIDSNCITVDGRPQVNTQDGCAILANEDTPSYTCLKGDLAAAYPELLNYTRELFFLKSGFLVVKDSFLPTSPVSAVTWHLQTLIHPSVTASGFVAAYPGAKLFGTTKGMISVGTVMKSADQTTPSYRVDLSDPSGGYLVALEAASAGQGASMASPFSSATSVKGFTLGGTLAVWALAPTVTFPTPGPGPHYVLGLKPNTPYAVATATSSMAITTSAAGILAWNNTYPSGVVLAIAEVATPPLSITAISPNPATSGTMVTITGSGFDSSTTLNWASVVYNPKIVSPTQLTFAAPTVGAPTAAPLNVVGGAGNSIAGPVLAVSPPPPPPKTFAATGTLTQQGDGSFTGSLTLTPKS